MDELPSFVLELLDEIARSEGFSKYSIESENGSKHGDNFVGVMSRIVLKGVRERDGEAIEDQLNLIIKLAPTNAARREEFKVHMLFGKEAEMYNTILPKLVEFQREQGLSEEDGFFSFPKCYKAVSDDEAGHYVIIMEDLKSKEFTMYPKENTVDINHLRLIVRELGKFHAITFAVRDKNPELFEECKNVKDIQMEILTGGSSFVSMFERSYDRVVAVLNDEDNKDIVIAFKSKFFEHVISFLSEGACEPFGAVTHGDCWINNILFQYEHDVNCKWLAFIPQLMT